MSEFQDSKKARQEKQALHAFNKFVEELKNCRASFPPPSGQDVVNGIPVEVPHPEAVECFLKNKPEHEPCREHLLRSGKQDKYEFNKEKWAKACGLCPSEAG